MLNIGKYNIERTQHTTKHKMFSALDGHTEFYGISK